MENRCDCEPQNKELSEEIQNMLPTAKIISSLTDFYKIMGDNTRIKLLLSLEHSELCVSDLSYILNMSRSAVSHQLRELKLAKLVKFRKVGKSVYYSLDDDHIASIIDKALEHILEN